MLKADQVIWILEDDSDCQFVYTECLDAEYHLRFFEGLEAFGSVAPTERPDLLIVDLKLKDGNFLPYLRGEFGKRFAKLNFVVVSSSDNLDILRTCFEYGASDYLTKPFTKSELIVKIERLLAPGKGAKSVQFEGLAIDPVAGALTDGLREPVQLTLKEFQIYAVLCRSSAKGISRDEIYHNIWKDLSIGPKTLDVHLVYLRRKLAQFGVEILYDPGSGYQLSKSRPQKQA